MDLNQICLQIVLAGVRDSLAKSRGAAVFAIGQLAEHCQPEIAQQARHILPAVFALVNDADQEVQEQAHYALQTFCDSLGRSPWQAPATLASHTHIQNTVKRDKYLPFCVPPSFPADFGHLTPGPYWL